MKKAGLFLFTVSLALLLMGLSSQVWAQTAADYTFSASSGTYTPLSGGTDLNFPDPDGSYVNNIPIGFDFMYAGKNHSHVNVSTNGFLVLETAYGSMELADNYNTNLLECIDDNCSIIVPLWDDLLLPDLSPGAYKLSGESPNRVFTVEWNNVSWDYGVGSPVISFQVKLYERSNKIEFVYKQEGAVVGQNSEGATIGLCSEHKIFLTLSDAGTSPTASSTIETSTIITKPATGQVYTFEPITNTTWTGATDYDWTNASNWSSGKVPDLNTNVTIPSVARYPQIYSAVAADCRNLTLGSGGMLDILTSATSTGSLIIHGTASGDINPYVFLAANQWHLVAPQVENSDINYFLANNNVSSKNVSGTTTYAIADYNEDNNAWNSYFTDAISGSFESTKGYSMYNEIDAYASFFGTAATGTKTINLTKAGEGWNCIGNPYTSAIGMNASAASAENFLTENSAILDLNYACVYLWDGASSTYKILGNLPSGLGGGRSLAQNYVQSGQAFFVKAKGVSQTATFTPAMQSHQNGATAPFLKSATASWPTIQLNMANGNTTASTIVAFNSDMTKGLDPTYDAGLLRGTTGVNLYSRLVNDNGVDFAIQALPSAEENLVIPIGVESKDGGSITFSAKTIELQANTNVVLEDKKTGTLTSLTNGGVYTTTVEAGAKGIGRFYLHTKSASTTTDIATDEAAIVSAYANNKTITISGKLAGATAQLFDINGKQVDAKKLSADNASTLDESKLVNGVYVLRVIAVGKVYSFKVVLK